MRRGDFERRRLLIAAPLRAEMLLQPFEHVTARRRRHREADPVDRVPAVSPCSPALTDAQLQRTAAGRRITRGSAAYCFPAPASIVSVVEAPRADPLQPPASLGPVARRRYKVRRVTAAPNGPAIAKGADTYSTSPAAGVISARGRQGWKCARSLFKLSKQFFRGYHDNTQMLIGKLENPSIKGHELVSARTIVCI